MNQDILIRLEKEAEKMVLQIPASLDSGEFTSLFNEKLAELIVQECADICNRIYFDRYPDAEDFERSEEGDAIKKHFGVEQ